MRAVILAVLLCTTAFSQSTYPAPGSAGTTRVTYCTPPTLNSRWYAWYQGNICGTTTVACISGVGMYTVKDTIGGNHGLHGGGLVSWSTNQVNALSAWATPGYYFALTSSIPTSVTTQSWYYVGAPTFSSTSNLIGASSNSIRWYIASSGKQVVAGSSGTVTGSTTLTSAVWVALYFTYNAGTVQLYKCSAGTCSTDGSSGSVTAPTSATTTLMSSNGGGYTGKAAEFGYYAGTSISGLGTYLYCQYPTI